MPVELSREGALSICPTCYRKIPAKIFQDGNSIMMKKTCPQHGERVEMIERDARFYQAIKGCPRRPFFEFLYCDITHKCNLKCRYCYYPVDGKRQDPTIKEIVSDCKATPYRVVLTGGEPTTREDLPDVIASLKAAGIASAIFTNGVKLADRAYLRELVRSGLMEEPGQLPAHLMDSLGRLSEFGQNSFLAQISMHPEKDNKPDVWAKKTQALENIRAEKLKIFTLMFTVTTPEDIPEIIPVMRAYKDIVLTFRIRSVFNNWMEKSGPRVFLSDLYYFLEAHAKKEGLEFKALDEWDNNVYHLTVKLDGMVIRLISCPDKENVDLMELLPFGPYHRAQSGELVNLMYSFMINEGIRERWINGRRINWTA